ncbi:MAG: ADP-forming succinate--CoA ligase subunit beta [Candidatus Thiodiazotropha weberae]|uniref:Succinate--CoA ligase [ADP-forming] subunit beta n=1 Tax=Candidatus Thiodiazotropha endoloripes TaxID=1818881 RepID=A0A1E2UMQ0_9GAMM|nr:ADP-forming succinate--CoA ligase subunit beta [Candidatus Thiodiazotropha endoloripes]MCG7897217.1 ADP-forming succinate--CoA ligase subunit beta [Candidatus Thiodiazotropha weberae]MCG7902215.1 ADP-forming succinate--CoA ligase subunit beta [Candidatus Thiodiazotropha weberae]ODB84273.1 succinate--CoA ligase subunit beta [Candidatus Thiodiazotropha endoloripes]ODB91360.1 succinate--CoA ligase subunit beta [Candidatus Thiodiazotropha endoloripes]ODB95959.1 succinate--CoA ligase subunit bet
MNLHEYQAKSLFASYGIPVPQGQAVSSPSEARTAAQELGGKLWVIKAQAHTGGRGKAGGVKLARNLDEVEQMAGEILGMTLVTNQTGPQGLPVNSVLVEQGSDIDKELYLGALLDRSRSRIAFMASEAGGMNIEEVAATTPEKILTTVINPSTGMLPYQCRKLAFGLGLAGDQIKQFSKIMMALYRLYIEKDISLIEINPLIITIDGNLMALDAKINLDSNALYRHQELVALRDLSQEDEKEAAAAQHDLNYITLDGTIGCMVNGAGLAMATMDMVKLHGGEPANFLDVGGGTTAERVTEAFKLILSDEKVKTVLVNIFGGIVRCDLIAEGIITAARSIGVKVPVVVRLEGTNASQGLEMLASSGLDFITANDFTEAAKKAVAAAA